MKKWKNALLAAPVALALLTTAAPIANATASPQVNPLTQGATDLGAANTSQTITVSIVFNVQDEQDLQNYINQTVTPGSSHYRKYLSVSEFAYKYGASPQNINAVVHYLSQFGIQSNVMADHLVIQATGTLAQFQNAFNVQIDNYTKDGKSFHAPKKSADIAAIFGNQVLAVSGLDNYPAFQSMTQTPSADSVSTPAAAPTPGATPTPGLLTAQDAASLYDASSLYKAGITGKGQTIGIATLANFIPQDAYNYWTSIGLNVSQNRITQVHVDGGAELSQNAGSGETTLDVEQSGGIAPGANIMVYDAPNTDQGFMDVFYQAVSDNQVNTLSVSWGSPEAFYIANGQVNELYAFNQAYEEAAAQGISTFAASGDSGAFDTVRDLGATDFSTPLTVDAPSSSPYITAAGGTTLGNVNLHMRHGVVNTGPVERAWAWDYFTNYLNTYYGNAYSNPSVSLGYFSVGGGGGVSSIFGLPSYQQGLGGINKTASGQSLTDTAGDDFADLPSGFVGRNTPDLSMNADPETGYLVYSTEDGGWIREGGTSFVAPQLNGITALINQYVGQSVGFLNPQLYALQKSGNAYGPNAPFNDIAAGDNWFYQATSGYDDATGIGTPNVANLAAALKNQH